MLERCLPACLHADLADLGARKIIDYGRNHPEDLAIWERGAGEVLERCLPACLHACTAYLHACPADLHAQMQQLLTEITPRICR